VVIEYQQSNVYEKAKLFGYFSPALTGIKQTVNAKLGKMSVIYGAHFNLIRCQFMITYI
jgi:hypothetical protein